VAAILVSTQSAEAAKGRFDGWCFPATACTGESELIQENAFSTCEDDCRLTKPTKVTDMAAMLYWIVCSGDEDRPPSYRAFFSEYTDQDHKDMWSMSIRMVRMN
jgi:hypothetical protein